VHCSVSLSILTGTQSLKRFANQTPRASKDKERRADKMTGENAQPNVEETEATGVSKKKTFTYEEFMEIYIDRTADRMIIAGLTGLVFGAGQGTIRGTPVLSTSLSTAVSCAVTATACFGSERLFYSVIPRPFPYFALLRGNEDLLSHACGGALGGSVVGAIYGGKPLPGMFLFTPMMLGVAFAERSFKQYKLQRLEGMIRDFEARAK
jgi:hypothetical protein